MKIAIVGFGPRGLACLENLILGLSRKMINPESLEISLFETSNYLGVGKAWDLDQPDTNYINISDHALQNLKGRERPVFAHLTIPAFPSYTTWCLENKETVAVSSNKDAYPERSQMGRYLHERARSICNPLQQAKLLEHIQKQVIAISYKKEMVVVASEDTEFQANECLLTIGHQPTAYSEETLRYKKHAEKTGAIHIRHPYEEDLAAYDVATKYVAIKGFGLTMLDVMRQLSLQHSGKFVSEEDSYFLQFLSGSEDAPVIIPYSYDGLPVVPKPFGREVDEKFEPSLQQLNRFEWTLRNELAQPEKLKDAQFLLRAVVAVAVPIFQKFYSDPSAEKKITELALRWLNDTKTQDALILNQEMNTLDYMKQCVAMAYGGQPPSLDFTIGQVWRHLQPTMYRIFAFCNVSGAVMKQIVDFDEQSKRYSYGPPVESILQLIALVEAGVVVLDFVNDPKVELHPEGWKIKKGTKEKIVHMLINSVMDAPVYDAFDSPILKTLKQDNRIVRVYEGLGIKTYADGIVVPPNGNNQISLAIVGRNAKGSILGADAILECFSPETQAWARGVVQRL